MNILDGVFAVVIILTAVRAVVRGLIKEVSFVVALVLSFVGASLGHEALQARLAEIIPDAQIASTVAYVLLFFAIFLLVLFLGIVVKGLFQQMMLGWLDRLGGAAVGVFKGFLLCGLIILLIGTVFSKDAQLLKTSRIAPHVIRISGEMASYVPEHYQEMFWQTAEELQSSWQDSEISKWLKSKQEKGGS